MTASKPLTPKQAEFVRQYLVDLNGTQAAIRAGYAAGSAEVTASNLLRNPKIASLVQTAMAERGERTKTTADDVLLEIKRLAMFDPMDLADVKSPQDFASLPEDVRRAIVGWGWDKQGNFTIKLAKQGALEMLGRHHGLFKDRMELSGKDGGAIEVNATLEPAEAYKRMIEGAAK